MLQLAKRFGMGLVCSALPLLAPSEVRAGPVIDVPAIWIAAASGGLWGSPTCQFGSKDCNACANDVEAQFAQIAAGGASRVTRHTSVVYGSTPYLPFGAPIERFSDIGACGDWREHLDDFSPVETYPGPMSHFQGFARVLSQAIPAPAPVEYAPTLFSSPADTYGSWYVTSVGGLGGCGRPSGLALSWIGHQFKSGGEANAGSVLYYFIPPVQDRSHIGGLAALGAYALAPVEVGGQSTRVDILDLTAPMDIHWPTYEGVRSLRVGTDFGITRAASVSAARLVSGDYLIAVQLRSASDAPHDYAFFRLSSLPNGSYQHIGTVRTSPAAEGMAMITECDTGKNFIVAGSAADGETVNHWNLLRVEGSAGAPGLTLVDSSVKPGYNGNCQVRGAATAYADVDGVLTLICHEKSPGAAAPHWWHHEDWRVR